MFGFKKDLKKYDLPQEELAKFNYAKITTDKGVIWIKLFNIETPIAVSNFATLANDGFYNIFYKQKNNQYAQYIQYITDYVKRIYKNSKYTNGIISENTIDIHINNSIDSLLQSSLYRSLIIVYDDFLVRSYNIEESIFTFFKFKFDL